MPIFLRASKEASGSGAIFRRNQRIAYIPQLGKARSRLKHPREKSAFGWTTRLTPCATVKALQAGRGSGAAALLRRCGRLFQLRHGAIYRGHTRRTTPTISACPNRRFSSPTRSLIFDHVRGKLQIVHNADIQGDPDTAYNRALAEIDRVLAALQQEHGLSPLSGLLQAPPRTDKITSNFTKEAFISAVEKAKAYIRAGDIFQVVLSQRFTLPVRGDAFNIYRVLRTVNPSPYLFYLKLDGVAIVGSSPEVMVRAEDAEVMLRPIAGTCPRSDDPAEDLALERDLLADEKEIAEHLMLVDLGRNDLGRVCEPGSVVVDELMMIERYSHVMHIVSNVRGRLAPGRDAFDLLRAAFPAGTLSGAPKVRAMEIIDELEPSRRGPYGGAIGYFGFSGNMDSCITIRTVVVHNGKAHIQAGAVWWPTPIPKKNMKKRSTKLVACSRPSSLQRRQPSDHHYRQLRFLYL